MGDNWNSLIPIERSKRGSYGASVFVQDQTSGVLDINFLKQKNTANIIVPTVINARSLTLSAGHGAVIGDVIELASKKDGSLFMQAVVQGVAGDVLTIDTPINLEYMPSQTFVIISTKEMSVDGSATPQVFSVEPLPVQKGDMVRLIVTMTDNVDMDFETFGGLTKLTNGCVLRVNNGDGSYRNIANFKSNGDIQLYSFDADYQTNNGGGVRSFTARMTWGGQSKHGVVVRLDGSIGEKLEIVVQDDLTGLLSMNWIAQGSEVQD